MRDFQLVRLVSVRVHMCVLVPLRHVTCSSIQIVDRSRVFLCPQTTGEYLWGISLVACLVLSLLLHECGHLVALRVAKMEVSQVLLHGFGGVTVPARPLRQQLQFSEHKCMAIGNFVAGPTANLVLAALFMVARIVAQASGVEEGPILDFWHGDDISLWLLYASFMNLALALYNLLPIYPLDVRLRCDTMGLCGAVCGERHVTGGKRVGCEFPS